MFLSYAVVPTLVITLVLNFFYLNYPVHSKEEVHFYGDCKECLNSDCHKSKRPCAVVNNNYSCFICTTTNGNDQYYSKGSCERVCKDPMKCVCDSACYMCVLKTDKTKYKCNIPNYKANQLCENVGYYTAPTKGSEPKKPPKGGYPNTGSYESESSGGSGDKNTETLPQTGGNPVYLVNTAPSEFKLFDKSNIGGKANADGQTSTNELK